MDLLKLEDQTLANLYEAFKDNDGFMVKEGDKYTKATNEILKLDKIDNLEELVKLRDSFAYTVSDLMTAARTLMKISKPLEKIYNVYSNMLQYVTVEIDMRISELGGEI